MNSQLAFEAIQSLLRAGVREICVCAGARSSPLVVALEAIPSVRKFQFFEERCAAFFALGRIKASNRPVAVVTTSGTAAAELFPAIIEAHYAGLPLVALTADRPRRFRGTGAPQAIDQKGLYGAYARVTRDIEAGEVWSSGEELDLEGPTHWNLCFDEPLLDGEPKDVAPFDTLAAAPRKTRDDASSAVRDFLSTIKKPLVVVGQLPPETRPAVTAFLRRLGAPVYLEPLSGLRESNELGGLRLEAGERVLSRRQNEADGVLRLGSVPTVRFWRDLEGKAERAVLSLSAQPFAGLTRGRHFECDLATTLAWTPDPCDWARELLAEDAKLSEKKETLLAKFPRSEPGLVRALARSMPAAARIYLGNSLPIREWDLAAPFESKAWDVEASRGANGIDGQLSTFFGFAECAQDNWALVGDLTALYDLSAPWILGQRPYLGYRLVVLNNGGGRIFGRMFSDPIFQNRHAIGFEAWARMWNMDYERWTEVPPIPPRGTRTVIELVPDEAQTAGFWREWDAAWAAR